MTSPNQNSTIELCIRTDIDNNNNHINSSCNLQVNETNQGYPESWSRQQVIDWIKWCSSEYGLHDIPINKFEMNGKALCMLTEEMFKQRVPNSGDILYRALKNLLPKTHQEQQQQQQSQLANSEFQLPGIKLDLNDSSSICSKNTQDIAQSTEPSTVNSVSSSSSSSFSSTNCSATSNTSNSYSNNSTCSNSLSANQNTTKPKLNSTKQQQQQQQPATLNKKSANNSLQEFKMKQNLSETASHNSIPMLSSSSSSSLLSSSSLSSSSSSTLLLQKSASKFLPLITINQNKTNEMSLNRKKSKFNSTDNETYDTNNKTELTDCNMENETESNNEQFDDEDTNNNNDEDNEDYDYDDVDSDEDQQTSPVSKLTISSVNSSITGNLNTNSPNFERKRTANLENLIGNLKVRKLNQSDPGNGKEKNNNNHNYHHNNSNNKMTSLYVDIANGGAGVGATSLSDCSPSTPPLSSPSVSPSSLSIASDSPVHASSFSSSSSSLANTHHQNANEINNQNNKSRYSMLPKLRWIIESAGSGANYDMNSSNEIKSAAVVAAALNGFDPAKLNEIINESWCADQASGATATTDSTDKTKKKSSKLTKKQQQQLDPESKVKTTSGNKHPAGSLSTGHKNQEDPTRQIKFYDDFIDFRGDVLRRPPDSKNCRILWEYLYLLLQNNNYSTVIRWEDEAHMVFRIVQAEKLAALWGLQKNRLGMTYEKLSRGMRYYYPNNIIAREPGRRLLYRFMRHPDEIKKFVKKNGTYMLKRAKMSAKHNDTMDTGANLDESMRTSITDINPDDSGVDEPLNGSLVGTTSTNATGLTTTNKNKQSKKKAANIDNLNAINNKNKNKVKNHSNKKSAMSNKNNLTECNREGNDDPDEDDDDEEFNDEANNNKDDSTVDEEANDQHSSYKMDSMSSSPYSGISHNSSGAIGFKPMGEENNNNNNNNNNNTNGEMKSNNNTQQANATAAFIAAMAGANRMYPDLYSPNDLFQYYAAAAGLQQSPIASAYLSRFLKSSPTSSSTSSTSSSKDDMNTAQLLMQLRNQNDSLLNNFNFENHNINNQFISDTIKNFTNLNRTTSNHHNLINNNNNNDNMQKSKRTSTARSNDLSSASSTSSNSSLEHSIDYEQNNQNQFSDKSFISRKQTKTKPNNNNNNINNEHINYEELKATHNNSYEYPLNLSICGNVLASNGGNGANSLKKRKSKYDV